MSNFLAIATVTSTLAQRVAQALQTVPNLSAAPEVRTGPPPHDPGFVGVNLLLYRVTPSPTRRNDDLPTRRADGKLVVRPQAALDLEYLLSFHGSETALEPQRLLGSVVAALHAQPVLAPQAVREAIQASGPHGILAESDLDQQAEPVRFVPIPLDLAVLQQIWGLYPTIPYALSIAYAGSTVLIDADLPPVRALPARQAAIGTTPASPPHIDRIEPPSLAWVADATLTVAGSGFGPTPSVSFDDGPAIAATPGDDGLTVALPPDLAAGVIAVRVLAGSLASDPVEVMLQPRLADSVTFHSLSDPQGSGRTIRTLTCAIAPMPRLDQPLRLFANPQAMTAPVTTPASAAPLRFGIDGRFAADLDQGQLSEGLRQALGGGGLALSTQASIAVRQAGSAWSLTDPQGAGSCRLGLDGGRIAVHFGLDPAAADAAVAFAIDAWAPGTYVLSVQIGDQAAASSPLRLGTLLCRVAADTALLDQGHLPPNLDAALRALRPTLPAAPSIRRPMPGDGWQVDGDSLWVRSESGMLAAYALDVPGGTYFAPAVSVPA